MPKITDIRFRRALSIALLALLLGAQSAQAGHFHADYLFAEDCLECLTDYGQALKSPSQHGAQVVKPGFTARPAARQAVYSTHYRRSARGPPSHSC